jgi:uncharacterized membrane protein YcaP (DUF421 family)
MAPFDLIVLFILAGITVAAVLSDDHSLTASFTAVSTIGLLHIMVSWAKAKWETVERIVDGTPVVIFENGRFHEDRMERLRLLPQDVMAAARQRGVQRLEQVRYAVAERDGKVSIIALDQS